MRSTVFGMHFQKFSERTATSAPSITGTRFDAEYCLEEKSRHYIPINVAPPRQCLLSHYMSPQLSKRIIKLPMDYSGFAFEYLVSKA